jgi:L-aminopeptidase/D-esterase-like protein
MIEAIMTDRPPTITDVPGVLVGHLTDPVGMTGCTVVVLPEPNVVTAEIRGAAPGTRETALLEHGMRVEQVQAILLTGGSAFGLGAADGVMARLEAEGRGHPTPAGPVPIVPAAVVFDLLSGDPTARPGPDQGAAAFDAATGEPAKQGRVGAGTGATVANWRLFDDPLPGGVGSFSVDWPEAVVGALAVVNAVGDGFTLEGEPITGGPAVARGPVLPVPPHTNTTLGVVATNARLNRTELGRLAVRAHDAIAACLRPAHTRYDGDAVFTVSCGEVDADPDALGEAAFEAVGRAIEAALRVSSGL